MEETVTITKKKYDRLVRDSIFLNRLEAAGVNNWEGYSFACCTEDDTEEDEDTPKKMKIRIVSE